MKEHKKKVKGKEQAEGSECFVRHAVSVFEQNAQCQHRDRPPTYQVLQSPGDEVPTHVYTPLSSSATLFLESGIILGGFL